MIQYIQLNSSAVNLADDALVSWLTLHQVTGKLYAIKQLEVADLGVLVSFRAGSGLSTEITASSLFCLLLESPRKLLKLKLLSVIAQSAAPVSF